MEEFVQYDVARLRSFSKNPQVKDAIKIVKGTNMTSLQFRHIKYFNYSIGKLENKSELESLIAFYEESKIDQFRLILDIEDQLTNSLIQRTKNFNLNKVISKTFIESKKYINDYAVPGILFTEVEDSNLDFFISTYLKCFEAENRYPESVRENFRLKLSMPENRFDLIHYETKLAGICGIHSKDDSSFLSVGGILPGFRELGLHKASICHRMTKCFEKSADNRIFSWAYDDSVSHQNMLKVGMTLQKKFFEYEFVK